MTSFTGCSALLLPYYTSSIVIKDENIHLRFLKSPGTTTILIERQEPADPIFVIDLRGSFGEHQLDQAITCPEDHERAIQVDGTTLGRISFPDSTSCSKAVIFFTPPPTLSIQLSLYVTNSGYMTSFGPYFIGQESKYG